MRSCNCPDGSCRHINTARRTAIQPLTPKQEEEIRRRVERLETQWVERLDALAREVDRLAYIEARKLEQEAMLEWDRAVYKLLNVADTHAVKLTEGWMCLCWLCRKPMVYPFEPKRSKLCDCCRWPRKTKPHWVKKLPPGDTYNGFDNAVRAWEERR